LITHYPFRIVTSTVVAHETPKAGIFPGGGNLAHARVVIAAWAADDNTGRPHPVLDCQTPADHAQALRTAIARLGSREMKAPRVGRLRNLRRSV